VTPTPAGLLVLLSGTGRTLLNLCGAIERGELDARVNLVVGSGPCVGLERARERGLGTRVVPGDIPSDRLDELARECGAGWVVLAGYLRLVRIPERLRGRVVNIHPALLPEFGGAGMYGPRVHRAVLAAGRAESGCTVHLCDERFDTGPIVLQERCAVLPGDTPETLAARVFERECVAYPKALQRLIASAAGGGGR
jgi:phosphoribosylglycinamide formyltransferase-1